VDRIDPQPQQPTLRTEPMPLAGLDALDRLQHALLPTADAVTVYETAGRYLLAEQDYRRTAAAADYDSCLTAHDEMAMCACQLADAGRLDLIGASA
jgi:hypothetical protein